jgi:DUF971 family protein
MHELAAAQEPGARASRLGACATGERIWVVAGLRNSKNGIRFEALTPWEDAMAGEETVEPDAWCIEQTWPSELRVQNNGHLLKVTFLDGVVDSVSSQCLRDALPRAARPKLARHEVAIVAIEQIEADAVRIGFDDGHNTGVYTWRLLRSLTTY